MRVEKISEGKTNFMMQRCLQSLVLFISVSLSLHVSAMSQTVIPGLDPSKLELASVNALVVEARTGEVLFTKNPQLIRKLSTEIQKDSRFSKPRHTLSFVNTNPLVRSGKWDVLISKIGIINEAGHCLVMLTKIQNREVVMVFLDSFGKRSHVGDATRVRQWMETGKSNKVPAAAKAYERRKSQVQTVI